MRAIFPNSLFRLFRTSRGSSQSYVSRFVFSFLRLYINSFIS